MDDNNLFVVSAVVCEALNIKVSVKSITGYQDYK